MELIEHKSNELVSICYHIYTAIYDHSSITMYMLCRKCGYKAKYWESHEIQDGVEFRNPINKD